jgi:hypothetical protein
MTDSPKAKPCDVCGEPAIVSRVEADRTETPLCAEHLPADAREAYERVRDLDWPAPPGKTVH